MVTRGPSERPSNRKVTPRDVNSAFAFAAISAIRAGLWDDLLLMFRGAIRERESEIRDSRRKG